MKFDVIVGNPPYQLSDGGASASALPIYHKFVQQAKKLNPRFLTMIIPARWYSGGKGLDDFRDEMLEDTRIRKIIDFPKSNECFPSVEIKGGVCYFLWDREDKGDCQIITNRNGNSSSMTRPLKEKGLNTLVRYNEAVSIIHKVKKFQEENFSQLVSARKPFGFSTDFKNFEVSKVENSIKIYANKIIGYVKKNLITQNIELIGKHKVCITRAYGAGEDFPHQILNKPFYAGDNSCCTETYLVIGPFKNESISHNVISYINTKFFRFLVLLLKNTQDATKKVYKFVPMQDFNETWTDEKLYKKYGLSQEEIDFIESMIRPMDSSDE